MHFVTFASAKTTLRPVLSGVYIREEKGNLVFVATDSYRLSEISIPTNSAGGEISCIVPTKVLEELRNILGAHKSDSIKGDKKDSETETKKIDVVLSNQQIEVHIGQTTLLSRLIEGKFPDYQQIIPKDNSTVSVLPTKELVTTVKRMHYFAKEANNNLTFKLSKESVHIATPQTQAGQDETTLAAGVSGEDNKIALSSSYLLDFLGHVDCPELEMHLTDSMHPAVFRIPGNDRFLHLIMPLRIQED